MWASTQQYLAPQQTLLMTMLILFFLLSLGSVITEALDQVPNFVPPDPSIKCGTCPRVNPCSQQQQLPPPPPPPPPPLIQYCSPQITMPPPPPPRFVYVTGPPGNLYPTEPFYLGLYSGGQRHVGLKMIMPLVVGVLVLEFLLFW